MKKWLVYRVEVENKIYAVSTQSRLPYWICSLNWSNIKLELSKTQKT